MKLTIHIKAPENEPLLVTINGQTQTSDTMNRTLCFDLPAGEHTVEFRQALSKSNYTPLHIILFLIFMLPLGILRSLLMADDVKWWKSPLAYCLKVQSVIRLEQDTELAFAFGRPQYSQTQKAWQMPSCQLQARRPSPRLPSPESSSPELPFTVEYLPNPQGVQNAWTRYLSSLLAVFSVAAALMGWLLWVAVQNGVWLAAAVCGGVIIALLLVLLYLIIGSRKKLRELLIPLAHKK